MAKRYIALILVLLFATFLLFYKLSVIPPGLSNDEVSEAYNAFSLLRTGADRYSLAYPLLFRSFGTYLMPLYTYITVGTFFIFGVSNVGVRTASVVSAFAILFLSFLIFKNEDMKKFPSFSIMLVFILSFSPWLIFFSRSSTEVTLSLAVFLSGIYFLLKSFDKPTSFVIGAFMLSLSSWAYYSEKFIALIFLPIFILVFRKVLLKNKIILTLGVLVFLLVQAPNLFFLKNGASVRRLDQVSYISGNTFLSNGGNLKLLPMGQLIYVSREFLSRYASYFSPRSLFFSPDDQLVRSMPDLSVFYNWMIVPFFIGFVIFIKSKKTNLGKVVLILLLISPIPSALTKEPFYTIRVLLFLWTVTIILTYGVQRFPKFLIMILFAYSLFSLYRSYFVLFKYERADQFGHQYLELVDITKTLENRKFVVDDSRDPSICLRFAFFTRYDPGNFQKNVGKEFIGNYYTDYQVGEDCQINNIEIRPIVWKTDVYKDQILVGDPLSISGQQASEHRLKYEFAIKNSSDQVLLTGYSTNPKEKCASESVPKSIYCVGL